MFVQSEVNTNKLWCSDCGNKIVKGSIVVFELSVNRKMRNVYCESCSDDYLYELGESSLNPLSEDGGW